MNTDKPFDIEISRAEASERSFMSQVYLWMAMGLALTGIVAWAVAQNPAVVVGIMRNPFLMIVLMLAQLGLVFWLSAGIFGMSVTTATAADAAIVPIHRAFVWYAGPRR